MSDVVTASHEPTSLIGILILLPSSMLEFMDVHSGGIVALCAVVGAICTVTGLFKQISKGKEK